MSFRRNLIVYRNIIVAMFITSFSMNLALLGLIFSRPGGDRGVAAYTLTGMAFTQFVGLILFKVFAILKKSKPVMAFCNKRQLSDDDWELYEQAALQRKMESDAEKEDSDGSNKLSECHSRR